VNSAVLDASVVLDEVGAEEARPHLRGGLISAVNYAEVLARTARPCPSLEAARRQVDRCDLPIVPFDAEQAAVAALAAATRSLGLSLADRACLALGRMGDRPVVTADRQWRNADVGVVVILIR